VRRHTGDPDAGGHDARDAGGMCSEFTPEYCPRVYPMSPVPMGTICEVFADMLPRERQLLRAAR
jgi:hypothetical protein